MDVIIFILEILLYILGGCFIVSTYILVLSAKKTNFDLVKNAITNPFIPDFDLSIFKKLQDEYVRQRSNHIPAIINKFSIFF